MPGLILGMDGAEPPPTDAAVGRCSRIAGLIHRRNCLTGPLEAPGISLVHTPSSRGHAARPARTCVNTPESIELHLLGTAMPSGLESKEISYAAAVLAGLSPCKPIQKLISRQ